MSLSMRQKKELEKIDSKEINQLYLSENNSQYTEDNKPLKQGNALSEHRIDKESLIAAIDYIYKKLDLHPDNNINEELLSTTEPLAKKEIPDTIQEKDDDIKEDKTLELQSMIYDVFVTVTNIKNQLQCGSNIVLPNQSRLTLISVGDMIKKILTKKNKELEGSIKDLKNKIPELSLWFSNKAEMKKMGILKKEVYTSPNTGRESLKYPDVESWLKNLLIKYNITRKIYLSEIKKINPVLAMSLRNYYYKKKKKNQKINPIIQL